MSNPADHVERVITAMNGKWLTPETEFIFMAMHNYISTNVKELTKDEPDSPFNLPSFDGALKAVCMVGAIGRDEATQTPGDVMEQIVIALSESADQREEAIAKMADAAIANIIAGKHVKDAPQQEPEDDGNPATESR